MIGINNYLDDVLNDFQEYLDEEPELCELKNVNFDGGRVPDYSDIHIQQLYLLRYAYAYGFEYKWIYGVLLEKFPFNDEIKVTSIGCGNMIDYWSLTRALKELRIEEEHYINYRGLDIIDWNYKFTTRFSDEVDFLHGDALEILNSFDTLDSDVYFFPKSISEFSQDDMEQLCNCFKEKYIENDTIHVIISLRSGDGSLNRDIDKSTMICNAISSNGFTTIDDYNKFYYINLDKLGEDKIRAIDDEFKHPYDIVNLLKDLNCNCISYIDNGDNCSKECKELLSRWPILSAKMIRYQILTFKRRK